MPELRLGSGFDVHQLIDGVPLVLGGVTVESDRGLAGDSDGDVLVHAIIDALLGAAAEGDMGEWFPPSDPGVRNAYSLDLLRKTHARLAAIGWRVVNVDATVIAQFPRIAPLRNQIRRVLADALNLDLSRVSVKATTPDHLGAVGRMEGVAAQAVALLEAPARAE